MSVRKDVIKIEIQENAYMLVYHKNIDIGFGSTVGLYLYDIEYLKFDCFGEKHGHYHVFNKKTDVRIYFTEKTVLEQINKVKEEMMNNIHTYLRVSTLQKIREFKFDMDTFRSKVLVAIDTMLAYEKTHYASLR
jgi:hypothetical protein